MEIHQRLRQLRIEKKFTRQELYHRMKAIFGDKTIKPNTVWRIESKRVLPRASSLHQICLGLGVSLKELLSGVKEAANLVDAVLKGKTLDKFTYNERASADILSPAKLTFAVQELLLLAHAKTETEEDPIEVGKFQKFVYCLSGSAKCVIGTEEHILRKGDSLSFESNLPHHFESASNRKSRLLIVQNPKHL